jgi:cell division inhibitor SulA
MPRYVIEREIPGAGTWTPEHLREVSQQSVDVLRQLGSEIQWVQSYVTGDKVYCIYIAPNEELVRDHARISGFPADRIARIETVIDPATAER